MWGHLTQRNWLHAKPRVGLECLIRPSRHPRGILMRMDDDRSQTARESRREREERRERERSPYKGVELVELEPAGAPWLCGNLQPRKEKRWRATMRLDGRDAFLGLYATAEAAARAHDLGVLSFGGMPDDLNFPPPDRPARRRASRILGPFGLRPVARSLRRQVRIARSRRTGGSRVGSPLAVDV